MRKAKRRSDDRTDEERVAQITDAGKAIADVCSGRRASDVLEALTIVLTGVAKRAGCNQKMVFQAVAACWGNRAVGVAIVRATTELDS